MRSKPKKNKVVVASIVLSITLLVGSIASAGYVLWINNEANNIYSKVEKNEETKKEDVKKIDKLTQEIAEIELDNSQLRLDAYSRRGFI